LAKTLLLESANMGDLGVLEIAPTIKIKGKFFFVINNSSYKFC